MNRTALVLMTAVLAAVSIAEKSSHPLIAALLGVPVQRATGEAPVRPAFETVTGDEPVDLLDSLAATAPAKITPAVRERVAARLAAEPDLLPRVLLLLPRDEAGAAAAWAAFRKLPAKDTAGAEFEEVRTWLRRNSTYFLRELAKAARAVKDEEGYVAGEQDLAAYARLDWAAAEPLLKELASGAAPRTAALAHALLYAHSVAAGDDAAAARERAVLRAIAEDRGATGRARDTAFEALMRTEWDGSVEWYLARFADPTLIDVSDGIYGFTPLANPAGEQPDLWIPRVVPLTRSENRVVRSNAAGILSDFHLEDARADALTPLIPWLSAPDWAEDSGMGRLRFVQTVGPLGLREAIPGLRWICRNDPDETLRTYAAEALLDLQAPNAISEVRAVLESGEDGIGRASLEQALVRSGLLTIEEMAEALDAYAAAVSVPDGERRLLEAQLGGGAVPWQVTVGRWLAQDPPKNEAIVEKLLLAAARGDEKGRLLGRIASTLDLPTVHRWLVSRLGPDSDSFEIVWLLEHRAAAARSANAALRSAVESGGIPKGIAAVALNDGPLISTILRDGTAVEREAVLAAARIVAQPLDVAEVEQAAENAKAAAAAELEMMNTAAARAALGRLYPGEARIWGARPWSDPGHTTYTFFDEWEEKLRALLRTRKFDRIDALARASYWGGSGEVVVIGRKGDSMQCVSTGGRAAKPVPAPASAELRQLFEEADPVELESYEAGAHDGVQYEYVFLTANGGRRVFMNNPPTDRSDPHGRLVELLASGCD